MSSRKHTKVEKKASFEIPPKKMVVQPQTYSMTIPEFCEQLALAIHPVIEGELGLQEALARQPSTGEDFSMAASDTAENVVLRRKSTESICSAGLYTAVHDGSLNFIHPLNQGPLTVFPEKRDEKDIGFASKSIWQQKADKHQVRLSDLESFARKYHVEIVWADVDNPMPRTRTKRKKTEARHQAWIKKACEIQRGRGIQKVSIKQLAQLVSSAFNSHPDFSASANTIRNVIRLHEAQIHGGRF